MPRNPKQTHIGPTSSRSQNVPHYIAPRESFSVPERVTNSSSRQPLQLSKEWGSPKRPGSEVAFSLPSRSFEGLKSPTGIVGQKSATAESASSEVAVGGGRQESL